MANYIGKIAAVVTVNNQQLARGLNASARDVDRFARGVRSTITSATGSAGRSFDQIFTSVQRLERAIQQARIGNLNIGVSERDADRIRALVGAANDLSRPLQQSVRGFENLSSAVQNEFIGSLVRAQNAAQLTQNAIERGQIRNAQGYENLKRVIDQVTESQRRLSEADTTVRGLATGRELRFLQGDFAAEIQRAAASQASASALPASTRRSGDIALLVDLQRREAEEATRLLAVLENIRNTRRGDAASAQAALDAQVQRLGEANARLERQVRLSNELRAITSSGPRGTELAFTNPGLQRELQASAAARQAAADSSDPARFAGLVQQLTQVESLIVGIQEQVSRRVDANLDTTDAQRRLEQARETARRYREEIEAGIRALASQEREQELIANTGARTPLRSDTDPTGRTIQQRSADIAALRDREAVAARQRSAEEFLGLNIPEAQRGLAALGASVNSVRDQVGQLPDSVRGQFVPALRDAQQEYVRLVSSGTATAAQIEQAAARARNLAAEITRAQRAAQAFGGTFRDFADQRDFRGAVGGLEFLRNTLTRATGDTTRAERALDDYAAALQRAASVPGGFQRYARELDQVQREAVEAIAATDGVGLSVSRIQQGFRRTGDVARGGFGNVQLAVQQAAFAVDDFFSVTGDLSQRIRAVGNNISQLGFVLGSTEGLVAGVAFSIGAQLVASLIKWNNSGTESKDRAEALNQALARQKSLVEELAQAFDALGDNLLRGVFSPAAEEARDFARQIEEIRRKQQELRNAGVVDLDPEVQRQRAIRGARERQLEGEENIGRRVALQQQINEARRAEQEAAQFAINRPAPTPLEIREILLAAVGSQTQGGLLGIAGLGDSRRRQAQVRDQVDAAGGDQRQLLEILRAERERLLPESLQSDFLSNEAAPARFAVQQLTGVIERLERELSSGINDAATELFQSISTPAQRLRDAQDTLREAVEAGVPGAERLLDSVNQIGAGLDRARQTIVNRLEEELPLDQATVDAAIRQRDAALRDAEATQRAVAATDIARQALERFADALDRASKEAQSNLQSAQQAADQARRADLGFSTPATRRAIEQTAADLDRQRELAGNVDEEVAAARERFSGRVREVQEIRRRGEIALGARRSSGEAFRLAAEAGIDARNLDLVVAEARERGNEELARRVEEAIRSLNQAQIDLGIEGRDFWGGIRQAVDEYESVINDAASEAERALSRVAEIDRQLQATGVLAPGQREELVRERARLEGQVVDLDDRVRRARDESTREAEQAAAAARGRELSLTPTQRAAEELARDLEAIRLEFGRRAEETTGLVDQAGLQEAQRRRFQEVARQQAPLLAGFADEVQNSILQGPSRAALQASDASTLEGQRELNRLLRGDDSARDVNLVELQRQTQALDELVRLTREGPQVAE